MTLRAERIFLPTDCAPESLCWSGDALIDWVSGGLRHGLDGSSFDPCVRYGYRFDGAVMSQDGQYAVIYERLGTKGLLLRQGKFVRELNRSYYHAEAYEYPVALCTLPSGRTLLAHCPDEYCRLELEDAETGERLTRREGDSPDVFHSRLQFSRDGRYLLSAGWVWHPVDVLYVFDVARALERPASLDEMRELELGLGDVFVEFYSAAFGERDTLVFHCSGDEEVDSAPLMSYSLTEKRVLSKAPLERPAGTMMVMDGYVVSFFEHPQLIELATGRFVERWPELGTGTQSSSICRGVGCLPPLAMDPVGRRFAVGTKKGIEVVRFVP
ncbi:hypothetical protein [Archangium lipolyticum]|uniref:hypothetical protein n=1 Tax=Archangium lipolyticum TaxID=2970465 RepID=UPI002149A138|nr:hypothetical protein [Archangium lipolyticum]